jgi:hypothetical protein
LFRNSYSSKSIYSICNLWRGSVWWLYFGTLVIQKTIVKFQQGMCHDDVKRIQCSIFSNFQFKSLKSKKRGAWVLCVAVQVRKTWKSTLLIPMDAFINIASVWGVAWTDFSAWYASKTIDSKYTLTGPEEFFSCLSLIFMVLSLHCLFYSMICKTLYLA